MGSIVKTGMKRDHTPREMRLVSEYVVKNYPNRPARFQVRLGSVHPSLRHKDMSEQELSLLRVWNRYADCIVLDGKKAIIIEGKIRPKLGPLEQLMLYEELYPHTPEYNEQRGYEIEKRFVYAVEDPVLNKIARSSGIIPQQFAPDWVPEYLSILSHRERRAPIQEVFE